MTGPLGNSEFCFPRISMFPETNEILGKQNSLFPSGPAIKCLLLRDKLTTQGENRETSTKTYTRVKALLIFDYYQ